MNILRLRRSDGEVFRWVFVAAVGIGLGTVSITPSVLAQSSGRQLTVEDIFAHGPLIGHPPEEFVWSPDGARLTYLGAEGLMQIDAVSGQSSVLVAQSKIATFSAGAADEQDRDHRSRYKQAGYLWSPDSKRILFDADGDFWLYDLATKQAAKVASAGTAAEDAPQFAPDGKSISFIKNHGLAVAALSMAGAKSEARLLTPGASATLLDGQVDWVYLEELNVRSNYFWSPDSQHLAYLEMDETKVPEYPITDWIPTHPTIEMQRYPQPGDPNPAVRVGVVSAAGGATTWITLPVRPNEDYIPRFGWLDAKTLWVETLTRDHKHMDLYFADSATGESRLALVQADSKFFDDKYDVRVTDGHILLTSWGDGHTHLYLYRYDVTHPMRAELERQLTRGDFDVDSILGINAEKQFVYFASNEGNPTEQQLWQVSFAGVRKQLTTEPGVHEGKFSPTGETYTDRYSNRTTPPRLNFCQTGAKCSPMWTTHAMDAYRLETPTEFTGKASDGTTLYATILLPEGKTDPASVPLILNPYGGPGPMNVENKWGGDGYLFDNVLAQHGFAVLHTDGRGSGRRGRDFAQAAYHDFGPVQFQDQIAIADAALKMYPQLDAKRQGWWGWSWGGTFTLYALTHSDRFRAGVSVAPVTDWRNYDSIYTERYMSEPAEFTSGYHDFSVVNFAGNLKGHLLLVHGTGDDNVHLENTIQFVQQMTVNNVPYSLNLYPRKTHSIAGDEVRPHLYNSILSHFEQYLLPPATTSVSASAAAGATTK